MSTANDTLIAWFSFVLALASIGQGTEQILLRDVTEQTGISFCHTDGSDGHRYIVETVSCGLAVFDFDNDGDEDIYFLNGHRLGQDTREGLAANALYRNDGDWKFTDVTEAAGVGDTGFGLGVAVADYNGDGNLDIYVNNYGANRLYRNNGDGTFTECAEQAGVANGSKVGAGTCFFDCDGDGDLDLFASSYVKFTYENHFQPKVDGYLQYASPRSFDAWPDSLFANEGDGTFVDVSEKAGIAGLRGTGMGLVSFDYDDDGDSDIFVCNDVNANFLLENNGRGHFRDVGLIAGVGYNMYGKENGSMGVDCGDFDCDGRLDLIMTSYQGELPVLYRNLGDGLFEDVTVTTGAGQGALPYVTWGTGFVDFDNDGDLDIFYACGHLQDNVDLFDDKTSYRAKNILMENCSGRAYQNVSQLCGDGLQVVESSRGAAFSDLDNDGDLDVVITNSRSKPTILRNDSKSENHWISLRLTGPPRNTSAIGARVRVCCGDLVQTKEVHSGRSYQSHYGLRLHFGLGGHSRIDRIDIRWPNGVNEQLDSVMPDQFLQVSFSQNH